MNTERNVVHVAAVADLHVGRTADAALQTLLEQAALAADVLLLGGDLTDHGLPEEAELLAKHLKAVGMPCVAVLGNHDYEGGRQDVISEVLRSAGTQVLDGDACEVKGVGFAGIKGFVGGFERHVLSAWGEETLKQLVREAIAETLKLEAALSKLRTPGRIALLHYAPIRGTVEGEPLEIFPFLGCSRMEEPLNRYAVTAGFHGHAHRGTFAGRTQGGVPIYNVAMPLLQRTFPDRPPFYVLEVPAAEPSVPHSTAGAPTGAPNSP